ncbi:hypothetical protein Y032_0310g2094 [Ancylostoma ceylanicum]|uniref:Uncharacterized protein n=1 Tax=Ancylostoma ceylanicum TaxID=53326 RepID=A0A016S2M0_9BILA|nr:hypothetical protein Y032_0310g2094 [Ancylostoma ceylanicum]
MIGRGYDELKPDGAGYDKVEPTGGRYVKMNVGEEKRPAKEKPKEKSKETKRKASATTTPTSGGDSSEGENAIDLGIQDPREEEWSLMSGNKNDSTGGIEHIESWIARTGAFVALIFCIFPPYLFCTIFQNILMTTLAIIFTMFIFCVLSCVVIILHHTRIVDWFPILTEITGEGFAINDLPADM